MIALPLKVIRGRRDEFVDSNGKTVSAVDIARLINHQAQLLADCTAREEKWLAMAKDNPLPGDKQP